MFFCNVDFTAPLSFFPGLRCWRVTDASRGNDVTEQDASGPLPRDRVIVPARLLCNTAATSSVVAPSNLPQRAFAQDRGIYLGHLR